MSKRLELLKEFNRKERAYVATYAFADGTFSLADRFRGIIGAKLGLNVPREAYATIDSHLDWLYAVLRFQDDGSAPKVYNNIEGNIKGSQEDIDLLVAYDELDKLQVILIEAKGVEDYKPGPLASKLRRLRSIFGENGKDIPNILPHFALLSPENPSKTPSDIWDLCPWVRSGGTVRWLELKLPDQLLMTVRCNSDGIRSNRGFWRVVDGWTERPRKQPHA